LLHAASIRKKNEFLRLAQEETGPEGREGIAFKESVAFKLVVMEVA
jgi:hypothetical protein